MTSIRVTEGQNTMNFSLRDTPMNNLARTMFEKIRVFPIVMLYF